MDIFDSRIYKNANIAILGTSGSGKTFTMQLMALRMRRKGIQVFIVAPLKGHEFHRACSNIGGAFIQISPASPNCINVMEIRQTDRSVDEQLDGGKIIAQRAFEYDGDDPAEVHRIGQVIEHELYVDTISKLLV